MWAGGASVPDDPFAEPGLDRTVMMPAPGGRAAPARRQRPTRRARGGARRRPGGLKPAGAAANPS